MIRIAPRSDRERVGWGTVLDLSEAVPRGWTLIGAQMAALHGWQHGRQLPRMTGDFDVLVNVRILRAGTRRVVDALVRSGFELDAPDPDGVSHRLRAGPAVVDVLAPDGIGPRAARTTLPPARTVSVPGGSQALQRTSAVEVELDGRLGRIPLPSLLGAILLKARAVEVSDAPDEQRGDLAFLLTLAEDPRTLARDLKSSERRWLKARAEMLAPRSDAWFGLAGADDGRLALAILAGL